VRNKLIVLFGGLGLVLLASAASAKEDVPGASQNVNTKIQDLATAITQAEGSPAHINNPGDLVRDFGYPTAGIFNSAGVLIFKSPVDGAAALLKQSALICTGQSSTILKSFTIYQMAVKYTGGDNASEWATSVADSLGVDVSTTLESWLAQ
jgi:hypothetical protein